MKARLFIAAMTLAVAAFAQDEKVAKPDSQTTPDNKTMQDSKTKSMPPAAGAPAEMKTQTYKGVLVDTSCGAPANPSASTDSNAPSRSSADRAAGQGCTVSANSSQLGLKMKDGRTVRFDLVGNQRAQDALKNKKKWTEAASGGKEIRVTVKGAMTGDKLIVSSID